MRLLHCLSEGGECDILFYVCELLNVDLFLFIYLGFDGGGDAFELLDQLLLEDLLHV